MPALHTHTLYAGPLLTLTDIRCRTSRARCGAEERAGAHELVFVRAGVFVKRVRGREIVAQPAHALFFNAHEPYHVAHPVDGGDDCSALTFPLATLAEVLTDHDPAAGDRAASPFAHTHAPADPCTLLAHQRLRRRLRAGVAGALEAEAVGLALLHDVVGRSFRARGAHPRPRRAETARLRRDVVEAAKLALASRPGENLSLDALARGVGSSPFHLARMFHAECGMPVHQFLLRVRLALALERLLDEQATLSSIALDLGFSSHSHFTALFRRTFGIAPSDFRRTATAARAREMRKNLEA